MLSNKFNLYRYTSASHVSSSLPTGSDVLSEAAALSARLTNAVGLSTSRIQFSSL